MPNIDREREHLAKADRDIAEGAQRINELVVRIQAGTAAGHDTTEAKRLLELMRETLEQWQVHRELILDAIARHERGE
ncbi:hypothetical protein [Methylobacterium isbiliense]|uniref:Uncharacterized protein n=1 Tax=Methylobacterium isbiliense TaxID=315478 RepID=A0ABQ4SJI6_9HYPH|nr:hypothetical protein [Methylobacterium isbiliense]MDN3627543.1 hypothetical protein [Methylobacterium isbiliense]GJE03342.1 hypothetical protein GMJLKIPL_5296 [Methylobacterium isbiliense]